MTARRTLAAAQRLYEEHKAITYPRTSSRFLTGDLVPDIRPTAELVGRNRQYARGAAYVTGLAELPLGRVVSDAKVDDHHAVIPTEAAHDLSKMGEDELQVYDLVAKRFLAVFHPEAVFERTRVETSVGVHVFRTSGRRLLEAGWKSVYGDEAQADRTEDDTGGDQQLPRLERGEAVDTSSVDSLRKETQPPRRFSEGSLLAAMETAGKEVEDSELREAMKDSGIGTPATRASIIERLIDVGYLEREGRALHAAEKGEQVIGLLAEHPLTSPGLTGDWERRLRLIEHGDDSRPGFMADIARFTKETVEQIDTLKPRIEPANLGPCPVCGHAMIENRKDYSCWSKDNPGCGFVVWKKKASKILPVSVLRELMASVESDPERRVGRTAKPVTGFRGRSGRTFRAKLKLEHSDEDGKWHVDFDEDWAGASPTVRSAAGEGMGSETPLRPATRRMQTETYELEAVNRLRRRANKARALPLAVLRNWEWSKREAELMRLVMAFPSLRLRDGYVLRGFVLPCSSGRVWAMPRNANLPDPPNKLWWQPPVRPPGALLHFMDAVVLDGTPWSYLSASLFGRAVASFAWLSGLGSGNFSAHHLLGSDGLRPLYAPPHYDHPPSVRMDEWEWCASQPGEWRPQVTSEGARATVTFHTYSAAYGEAIYRHIDTYESDSSRPRTEVETLARGGSGYVT